VKRPACPQSVARSTTQVVPGDLTRAKSLDSEALRVVIICDRDLLSALALRASKCKMRRHPRAIAVADILTQAPHEHTS